MKQILRISCAAACILAVAAMGATSNAAGIGDWLDEVNMDTLPGYTTTGIAAPTTADIGVYDDTTDGGVSYEFIANASDDGTSSAFMGSFAATVGDSASVKFEQWSDLGTYGATAYGVADYDSLVPHILNQNHQVVFVNDGTDTALYVNGVWAGSMAGASPTLSGLTGLAQAYRHDDGGSLDPLTGTLLGVAVYDAALSADEISAHWGAFIPEPSSFMLVVLCAGLLGFRRR